MILPFQEAEKKLILPRKKALLTQSFGKSKLNALSQSDEVSGATIGGLNRSGVEWLERLLLKR